MFFCRVSPKHTWQKWTPHVSGVTFGDRYARTLEEAKHGMERMAAMSASWKYELIPDNTRVTQSVFEFVR